MFFSALAKTMLDFRCYLKNIPTAVNASAIPTPGVNGFEQRADKVA